MRFHFAQSPRARRVRPVLACVLLVIAVAACSFMPGKRRAHQHEDTASTEQKATAQPVSQSAEKPASNSVSGSPAATAGTGTPPVQQTATAPGAPANQTAPAPNSAAAGKVVAAPAAGQPATASGAAPASQTAQATNPSSSAPNATRQFGKLPAGVVEVPYTSGVADEVLAGAPNAPPVLAAISAGQMRGERLIDGTIVFRGIPYARPPVGSLRWRPPEPVEPWTGVRDAVSSGPPCLQAPLGWNNKDAVRGREDCLYLDVRTPALPPTARRPVMVWIHGGANWAGSGSGYLTSNIAQRGVVLVTLQYRLGVFGFLSHPALTAESANKSSGNYGLLDQIAALQWVKANIAKLGGDPNNVTIFGHSSGGQDVGLLMLSPLAKDLFAKAIEQSGTAGFGLPARTLAENERLGEAFAAAIGVPASAKAPLEKMRAAYTTAMLAAGNKLNAPALEDDSFIWLQAVVDGWVLPRAPADLLAERKQHPVPLLIGSAAREFSLYGGPDSLRHSVEVAFGPKASQAIPLYGLDQLKTPPEDARLGDMATQLAADINFRCPVTVVSKHHQAAGARVWQYQLDRASPNGNGVVSHGAELPYVFDAAPIYGPVVAADRAGATSVAIATNTRSAGAAANTSGTLQPISISATGSGPATMQAYWVRFATTGDPNGPGLPRWPEYTRKREYLEFTEGGPIAKRDLRASVCDLLNRP